MDKQLFVVDTHIWGSHYDSLVPVSSTTCSDCGKLLYRLAFLGMREFYFLSVEEQTLSTLEDKRSLKPTIWIGAEWPRKNLQKVDVQMQYRGWDEQGIEHDYCQACASKVIECECTRCHAKFTRTRDLPGGWACERCFIVHCQAMCNIKPGERVAGLLWGDKKAKVHYELEMELAEEDLIAKGILDILSGGAS